MKTDNTSTRLESILAREFEIGHRRILLSGTSSPLTLSYFLSQSHSKEINDLPHLVVVPSLSEANRLQQQLEAFDPTRQSFILPDNDVSPYVGLYPSPQGISERLAFLSRARQAKPGEIFIATSAALSQRTLPRDVFDLNSLLLKVGDELPNDWATWLNDIGYESVPVVEDRGQFALRGGIIDIWSPAEKAPVRLELFGDEIESFRFFNPGDQRSTDDTKSLQLVPAREAFFQDDTYEDTVRRVRADWAQRQVPSSTTEEILRSILQRQHFPELAFLLPFLHERLDSPLHYFSRPLSLWFLDPESLARESDERINEWRSDERASPHAPIHPPLEEIWDPFDRLAFPGDSREVTLSLLETVESENRGLEIINYRTFPTQDFAQLSLSSPFGSDSWFTSVGTKLRRWRDDGYRVFVGIRPGPSFERLAYALERMDLLPFKVTAEDRLWDSWLNEEDRNPRAVHLIPKSFSESLRLEEERLIFLKEDDFFGRKDRRRAPSAVDDFQSQAKRLAFGDLKPGDLVVHVKHGIGQYEGLKIMNIGGVESEYIQVAYKDKDKLYLPVYRVGQLQKYSGATNTSILDKLGGTGWEKTKTKVRAHLRDVASDLLALYAKRAEAHRPAFVFNDGDILQFEKGFPFEETDDQLRAIADIRKDLGSTRPMDRLVCGDVGFGKTEVAMRAAFFAVQAGQQVAVLAPTTVLTFQHFETFKKRFEGWPVEIRVLNRFVPPAEAKKTVAAVKEGKVDIIVGTHKLLAKDVAFQNLGLLVIDEEQKFGVVHKEKVRRFKVSVDTLTLSATPIPRTLNMSFVGVRDLSLINTAPVDRLPTRTFMCKWEPETIRKAIMSEIGRGGQVYFIHNRVQSIYGVVDEIRQIVPEARIRVAHGQMEEHELEQAMLAFFHHEIDVLVCTAIVESGMDVPRANTMFIDRADMFGLSQLYQLRGRVGRSKLRAYCYLILPKDKKLDKDAQERLRVIQENTALGSGIRIAQYDLELRGAGTIIGEEQSGHMDSVGYELYMDLLHEALSEAKGESVDDAELDPEINLRVPALIPDNYIKDVRIRLSYYKALADIRSEDDLSRIGDELRDQFGEIPEPVLNLMGLMLIRRQCKDLGVRDISAGVKNISLIFTERTPLKTETVVKLAMRENKKYAITPDNRLNIRLNNITWTGVYEELNLLLKLV
ncbi:MAG: transcription-repair coupling factor [Bdellovibrionaceae bacterium]|nr:transcription-repair coupling factor [Pseudobdellovibrionaceae bacterium]